MVIHNYTAFAECFPEAEERLSSLARDCGRFGIHLLVTAAASGGIRYRSLQNFSQLLTLQQSDPAEYSVILGQTNGLVPGEQKGRGLIRRPELVEFQTAAPGGKDAAGKEPAFAFIQIECRRLRDAWQGTAAPILPAMPEKITVALLGELASEQPSKPLPGRLALPIGYDCTALVPFYLDLSARGLTPVLSEGSCLPFFTLLAALLPRAGRQALVLDQADPETVEEQMKKTAGGSLSASDVLLIPDLPALFDALSEEAAAQLRDVLERAARNRMPAVVFGGSPQEISAFSYEKWFRTGVSARDGIWIGPGFSGQYLLKASGAAAYDGCSPQTALCLQGGRAVPVRLPEEDG